jgi:hypothetical protein
MEKYIEEVGPYNVVQICTNNTSFIKAAADIITKETPHIYFQGCSVHANESLIGRLEEGDMDERSGEEIEDN